MPIEVISSKEIPPQIGMSVRLIGNSDNAWKRIIALNTFDKFGGELAISFQDKFNVPSGLRNINMWNEGAYIIILTTEIKVEKKKTRLELVLELINGS